MSMTGVCVAGRGIAAATAAICLTGRGIAVTAPPCAQVGAGPLVMLGQGATGLLRDVFAGADPLMAALAAAHPITTRVVRWGDDEPAAFDHAGLVIGGDALINALPQPFASPSQNTFTLTTTPPDGAQRMPFGAREAIATPVVLTTDADPAAALVEAHGEGWLFLIPTGETSAWLLSVGAPPDVALCDSRLIAPVVGDLGAATHRFETAPRMLANPAETEMLTIGSSAIAFDPVCGDGTAMAVRGGILAAAVAAALVGADGPALDPLRDRDALLSHYRAMLIAAMRRHIALSLSFCTRGGTSAWWRTQADALHEGHGWCTRQLATVGEASFMLADDRIVRRTRAA